ncbi:YciI family protein [Actinomyces oricola]
MTHVAVLYEYGPDTQDLHAQHAAAHVAFLQRLLDQGILSLSGRLDLDGRPGALLVLAVEVDQATSLLDEDPFWASGVVAQRRVWPWNIVFGADALAR